MSPRRVRLAGLIGGKNNMFDIACCAFGINGDAAVFYLL